jgi:hypothetical protein
MHSDFQLIVYLVRVLVVFVDLDILLNLLPQLVFECMGLLLQHEVLLFHWVILLFIFRLVITLSNWFSLSLNRHWIVFLSRATLIAVQSRSWKHSCVWGVYVRLSPGRVRARLHVVICMRRSTRIAIMVTQLFVQSSAISFVFGSM